MEYGLALIVLAALVALAVTGPLVRGEQVDRRENERRAELEAAKEAKYREIRDAELDYRVGKLSEADWRATDRELRGQAIAILARLDEVGEDGSGAEAGVAAPASEAAQDRAAANGAGANGRH